MQDGRDDVREAVVELVVEVLEVGRLPADVGLGAVEPGDARDDQVADVRDERLLARVVGAVLRDDVDHGRVVAAVQVDELLGELAQGDQEELGLRRVEDAERPDRRILVRRVHRAVDAEALDDREAARAGAGSPCRTAPPRPSCSGA